MSKATHEAANNEVLAGIPEEVIKRYGGRVAVVDQHDPKGTAARLSENGFQPATTVFVDGYVSMRNLNADRIHDITVWRNTLHAAVQASLPNARVYGETTFFHGEEIESADVQARMEQLLPTNRALHTAYIGLAPRS